MVPYSLRVLRYTTAKLLLHSIALILNPHIEERFFGVMIRFVSVLSLLQIQFGHAWLTSRCLCQIDMCAMPTTTSLPVATNSASSSENDDSGTDQENRPRRRRTPRDGSARPPPRRRSRPPAQAASDAPFDGRALVAAQSPNEDAPHLDLAAVLEKGDLRCMTTPDITFGEPVVGGKGEHDGNTPAATVGAAWKFHSLDEIYDGLSERFNADADFRTNLRMAIRQDIFDTTPFYANLSAKAAEALFSPDSSLEGSWRKPPSMRADLRMVQTTKVLQEAFGNDAITGDELMAAVGALCGPDSSTHFIDIYGVQDRSINHSWHMDGQLATSQARTVLWGFPVDNNYQGCGVFSHFVPLQNICIAPESHPRMEPLLFAGTLPTSESIVRPMYAPGRELMVFRDVESLHSAPDVTYRMSLMRFM